jgi:hypothetical protein
MEIVGLWQRDDYRSDDPADVTAYLAPPCVPCSAATAAGGANMGPIDLDASGDVFAAAVAAACDCCFVPECPNCDDGNQCTRDYCQVGCGTAYCVHESRNCDDGMRCTSDSCNSLTGGCEHRLKNCNDGLSGTYDSCEPATRSHPASIKGRISPSATDNRGRPGLQSAHTRNTITAVISVRQPIESRARARPTSYTAPSQPGCTQMRYLRPLILRGIRLYSCSNRCILGVNTANRALKRWRSASAYDSQHLFARSKLLEGETRHDPQSTSGRSSGGRAPLRRCRFRGVRHRLARFRRRGGTTFTQDNSAAKPTLHNQPATACY